MKRVWLAVACTLFFFVAGSLPAAPGGSDQISDKVLHCVGFGLLGGLWCLALRQRWPRLGVPAVALGGFLLSSAFGGLLELWQGMLGYRSRELLDWIADIVGALGVAGAWAAWAARGRTERART